MKDIYQQASIVLIWLGDGNKSSEQAFDALHGMLEHLDWQDRMPSWVFDSNRMARDPKKWRAIGEILCRPWFRRMWVIQEVLAARKALMLCGRDVLGMDLFLKIINSMLFANALHGIMSYHPNRDELSRGATKVALKQLEFLVKAKFEQTNWMTNCKYKPTLLSFLVDTRWG